MEILSTIFFLVTVLGFGSLFAGLLSKDSFFERLIIMIGLGLASWVVLGSVMSLLRVPLNWWFFFSLATGLLIGNVFYRRWIFRGLTVDWKKIIIPLVIFSVTLTMHLVGTFSYSYLHNDDPWGHSEGSKYVAVERNISPPVPEGEIRLFGYLGSYPPGFDMLMGIIHQTNDSINWTLKFFTSLIVSIGVLFFFFFAKRFMGSEHKALFATFVFASIPAYLTHFIWAHALIITLFPVMMYCLERIRDGYKWVLPAGVVAGGMLLTQPGDRPIQLGLLVLSYILIKSFFEKRVFWQSLMAGVMGVFLSLSWWAFNWRSMLAVKVEGKQGVEGLANAGFFQSTTGFFKNLPTLFPTAGGSATRVYTWKDYVFAKGQNMINSPVGIGLVVSVLTVTGIISTFFTERKYWKTTILIWFLIAMLFANSIAFHLPIGLKAGQWHVILVYPVSFLATEGAFFITSLWRKS